MTTTQVCGNQHSCKECEDFDRLQRETRIALEAELVKLRTGLARLAFKRGLALHAAGKSGYGLVPATVAWATRIADGAEVTPEKARKGAAWHARHAVDERPGWGTPGSETPGYVAYMLWGGAPGRSWFNKLTRQMDAADNAQESTMKTRDEIGAMTAAALAAREGGGDDEAGAESGPSEESRCPCRPSNRGVSTARSPSRSWPPSRISPVFFPSSSTSTSGSTGPGIRRA